MSPTAVLKKLTKAARKGRLPEYEITQNVQGQHPGRFEVLIFGHPYDRTLLAEVHEEDEGSTIAFTTKLRWKFPIIMIVLIAITIWPGVWLTDSMFETYFASYPWFGWPTWVWWVIYEALVLIAIPPLWKQYTKSERKTAVEARDLIEKIGKELGTSDENAAQE